MLNFLAFMKTSLLSLNPKLFKSKEMALLLRGLISSANTMTRLWHCSSVNIMPLIVFNPHRSIRFMGKTVKSSISISEADCPYFSCCCCHSQMQYHIGQNIQIIQINSQTFIRCNYHYYLWIFVIRIVAFICVTG